MTRKDYVLIASAIHETLRDARSDEWGLSTADQEIADRTLSHLTYRLAEALYGDNTRFDIHRFCQAIGLNPYVAQ